MVHHAELLVADQDAFDITDIVMFCDSQLVRIVLFDTEIIGGWLVAHPARPTDKRTVRRRDANPLSLNDLLLFMVLFIFIVIEAI